MNATPIKRPTGTSPAKPTSPAKQVRVGLYLRVSTDEQTLDMQRTSLEQACAARGWQIALVFEDPGISGAKGRDKRPGFDALLRAVTRRRIDVVAAWSVDRLGRSLQDLVGFLGELNAAKCGLYLDKPAVDTTTPAGRALFQMLGVFAEFERSMIRDRVLADMARAKLHGTKSGKPIGRPEVGAAKVAKIKAMRASGVGILKTARQCGVGTSVVQRLETGPELGSRDVLPPNRLSPEIELDSKKQEVAIVGRTVS